jgi:UDP-N-acetylglucosamine 4,6-dehydratase
MREEFPDIQYVLGDVRDREAVFAAAAGCERVVHTAALKHVATGQAQPWEVAQTNVIGTKHVVDAANHHGARMVLLSTDKAVEPVNYYGASKMLAEGLVLTGGQRVVRYGNVFGSRGSVLHKFADAARNGDGFHVTDRRMTRFVITFRQAIELVLGTLNSPPGLLVAQLPAMRIVDLARAFDADAPITEFGVQPGEKLAESLEMGYTSEDAPKLTVEQIQELIRESV